MFFILQPTKRPFKPQKQDTNTTLLEKEVEKKVFISWNTEKLKKVIPLNGVKF